MSKEKNVELVQTAYAMIGKGDIPQLFELMTEDVELRFLGPEQIPFSGSYKGYDGVGQFFQTLAKSVEIEEFQPREFIADGDSVVVLGREKIIAKPTGTPWESEWAMVWTVSGEKIRLLREYHQTYTIAEAFAVR